MCKASFLSREGVKLALPELAPRTWCGWGGVGWVEGAYILCICYFVMFFEAMHPLCFDMLVQIFVFLTHIPYQVPMKFLLRSCEVPTKMGSTKFLQR